MASVDYQIGGALWSMPIAMNGAAVDTTTFQINASGERVQLSCKTPIAGDIDGIGLIMAAVANAPDDGLRLSLQDPDANGLGDGTPDQSVKIASGSVVTGFLSGTLGATRTVTRGSSIVIVADIETFTAGDDITVQSCLPFGANSINYPFGVSVTNTISATRYPQFWLHYSSPSSIWIPAIPPILPALTIASESYDNGTTIREYGIRFQVPFPCKLGQFMSFLAMTVAGSDFDYIVYDSSSTVLATLSHDGDYKGGGTNSRLFHLYFQSDVQLSANTTYRVAMKPTTANNISMQYYNFPSALAAANPGGVEWCGTWRDSGGTWTDYNSGTFRYPTLALGFTAFDNGAGGGGGMLYVPNLAGT